MNSIVKLVGKTTRTAASVASTFQRTELFAALDNGIVLLSLIRCRTINAKDNTISSSTDGSILYSIVYQQFSIFAIRYALKAPIPFHISFFRRNERVTSNPGKDGPGTKPDGSRLASASSSPPTASNSSMDQAEQREHRPLAFEKMEGLVQEMTQAGSGVPVRSQKQFLTSIPYAFTGYDLVEWLIVRLDVDDPVEAISVANQLCHYGYFFPVSDSKNLIVKDDGTLYRFQIPYYWPCQHRNPDNVEYAIYLVKRSLRNRQRHALEDYEQEALNSLKKNLANKWDFITVQAEEQVKIAKERKKIDKIVADSQEKAYWRIHRPPPGYASSLELLPPRSGSCTSNKKRRTSVELKREVEFLRENINRTRLKASAALDNLVQYSETYFEYDYFLSVAQPSNPWVADDMTFWQLNSDLVEVPTEKRVKRWALSMEDLVTDPTGLQEFTNYLRKEYSHENIRFWLAAKDLRSSSQSQIAKKVQKIYEEFLAPGAPCEINIDGKTMEKTQAEMKNPSRFTFDAAAEHVYTLLLKKDCYPRFIRSDHYKHLLTSAVQPTGKKKFDFFGFQGKLKNPPVTKGGICGLQSGSHTMIAGSSNSSGGLLHKRRGSDRSLTGSTQELMITARVSHSHSQSNITEIPYRGDIPFLTPYYCHEQEPTGGYSSDDVTEKSAGDDICPWDVAEYSHEKHRLHLCPSPQYTITEEHLMPSGDHQATLPATSSSRKNSSFLDSSSSSDVSLPERLKKSCILHDTLSRFSRRSSSAVNSKQGDSTRPSVSSTEDLTTTPFRSFDSNAPSIETERESAVIPSTDESAQQPSTSRRRSLSAFVGTGTRKQSTSTATPLISVSSVTEQSDSEDYSISADVAKQRSHSAKDVDDEGGAAVDCTVATTCSIVAVTTASTAVTSTTAVASSATTVLSVKEKKKTGAAGDILEERTTTIRSPSKKLGGNSEDIVIKESIMRKVDSTKDGSSKKPIEATSPNEVCPWEDEESCKVKASSYMKFYETLGYL